MEITARGSMKNELSFQDRRNSKEMKKFHVVGQYASTVSAVFLLFLSAEELICAYRYGVCTVIQYGVRNLVPTKA